MRLHGMSKDAWKRHLPNNVDLNKKFEHYDVKEIGHKYNMTDLNASMGIVQLKKIEKNWKLRKKFLIPMFENSDIYQFFYKKLTVIQ